MVSARHLLRPRAAMQTPTTAVTAVTTLGTALANSIQIDVTPRPESVCDKGHYHILRGRKNRPTPGGSVSGSEAQASLVLLTVQQGDILRSCLIRNAGRTVLAIRIGNDCSIDRSSHYGVYTKNP